MDDKDFLNFVKPFININMDDLTNNEIAILSFKNQISYASQINELVTSTYLSYNPSKINEILSANEISKEQFISCISTLKDILNNCDVITSENANNIVNSVKEKANLKGKPLFMSIRLITIGKEHGPEMNKILSAVGKNRIINNIDEFLKNV
jgi:lysyl-tRNA synthetase class I